MKSLKYVFPVLLMAITLCGCVFHYDPSGNTSAESSNRPAGTNKEVTDEELLEKAETARIANPWGETQSLSVAEEWAGLSFTPPADEIELEIIFSKVLYGQTLTVREADQYRTALMQFLAAEYASHDWAMELHIGPMRNNNTKMFASVGPDTGFDSIGDDPVAFRLSRFLDSMASAGKLPKTVLFTLNPRDNYVIGSMLGNFQTEEAVGKMQFGSGWWFNDHIDGMREQMRTLANLGALGSFVGMVTDSRSFLSYPRHEYFRRILCDLLGDFVEQGLYPADMDTLCEIVRNISFDNARRYFGLQ